jgi:hypothetical protein
VLTAGARSSGRLATAAVEPAQTCRYYGGTLGARGAGRPSDSAGKSVGDAPENGPAVRDNCAVSLTAIITKLDAITPKPRD